MRAILPLPHFIEALTISSGIGTIQHLCLCQRSLIMGFLGYWFLFFPDKGMPLILHLKADVTENYPLNVTELPHRQLAGHLTDGLKGCVTVQVSISPELTLLTQHTPACACRWTQHCMNTQLGISFLQSEGFSWRVMVTALNQTQKANSSLLVFSRCSALGIDCFLQA